MFASRSVPTSVATTAFEYFCAVVVLVFFASEASVSTLTTVFIHVCFVFLFAFKKLFFFY